VTDSTEPIRILLVDDHALFRESVARFLGSEPGIQVVGECGSLGEALGALRHGPVDLVLLDIELEGRNGTHFLPLAENQGFAGQVLVVTAGVSEDEAAELIGSGVSGIFMKHKSAALLAQAVRDVMAGKLWFDRGLLQDVLARGARPPDVPAAERFSLRERQVFSHVLEGLANKEIAARLGVSESSVKATLQQLFAKTGVRTRSQLVRIALEQYRDLAVAAQPTPKSQQA
jgi:two-component system, NarL family, nitrate/nitrite response regulator NarL